jgi:hypothetical protein
MTNTKRLLPFVCRPVITAVEVFNAWDPIPAVINIVAKRDIPAAAESAIARFNYRTRALNEKAYQ